MSKEEELAWEAHKKQKFSGMDESTHAFVMYRLCFLAGYRAAQQNVQPTVLCACGTEVATINGVCVKCGCANTHSG